MTKFSKAVAVFGILGTIAFSVNGYAEEAKTNCQISITNTSSNGQKEKIKFATFLNSKAECRALARIHERATPQPSVASKKVAFKWKKGHSKHFAMR